jgi:choline dehydrogenase
LWWIFAEGPRVVGVAYTDLEGGNHTAFLRDSDARSEVIVAAGALGSPQLLMLSGVGPADHLAEFNITTVVENPAVGSQMADNPTNSLWVLTSEEVEVALIQVVGITSFGSYIKVSSGQAEALLGVLREDESKVYERRVTAQVLQSRIIGAILGTPRGPLRARAAWGGTVLQKIWGPQSRGLLRLASLDAGENPRVRFNYFQEEADLATCERGVRLAMDAVTAPALARLQYTNDSVPLFLRPVRDAVLASWPQRDASNATQDSINLRDWCLDSVITIWHYHGGCLVGEVVDPDYRVMGVQALRVIDGSTFRQSPGTNPQATVMMLGRYMGVQILRDRLPGSYTAN